MKHYSISNRPKNSEEYQDYLKSEHWQQTRKSTLADRNYKCENCGKRGLLHVHHLTYKRLGEELPGDLQVLCPECHRWEHFPMSRIEAELEQWAKGYK